MKIKVKAEGRKDVWLVADKQSLIDYVKSLNLEVIHNFKPGGMFILGADHSVESVLSDIQDAERIAVFTDKHHNMGHSLAIADTRLECYDIGELTPDNLEVVE